MALERRTVSGETPTLFFVADLFSYNGLIFQFIYPEESFFLPFKDMVPFSVKRDYMSSNDAMQHNPTYPSFCFSITGFVLENMIDSVVDTVSFVVTSAWGALVLMVNLTKIVFNNFYKRHFATPRKFTNDIVLITGKDWGASIISLVS